MEETRRIYPKQAGLELCDSAQKAVKGADALVIMTEWQEFRSPDFQYIKQELKDPVIFDGRNLYDPALLASFGLAYFAIGRGGIPGAASKSDTGFGRRSTDTVKSKAS
jgi:UDPglucose 6-dehydrogenase